MGRADGIHMGTGEEPRDGFSDLLAADAPTVLNEPEAKHWWSYVAGRGSGLTIWRASPSARPASVGWDAHAFSREIFRSLDEHHDRFGVYPTDVLLLNELNLDYERGENQGAAYDTDPNVWPELYARLARFLGDLLDHCKDRAARRNGFAPRWWFQGWAPGHGEMTPEIAAIWVPIARRYDGIVLHAYYDVETITSDVLWYESTFPDHPLCLGEYNTIGVGGNWREMSRDEREAMLPFRIAELGRIRSRLHSMCRDVERLSAVYFIHYWAEDDSHEHDVRGVPERRALFDGSVELPYDDWTLSGEPIPEPEPEPVPMPEEFPLPVDDHGNEWQASTQAVRDAINEIAPQEIDRNNPYRARLLLTALAVGESGEDHQSQERWHIWTNHGEEAVRQRNRAYAAQVVGWGRDVGTIGTNDYSAGPFHQAWAWWDEFPGDPTDPGDPHRWDVDGWLRFRKRFIQDHGYATRYAAQRVKPYYDQRPNDLQWVLERYNKPNGAVSDGVRANYARALVTAARLLESAPEPVPVPEQPAAPEQPSSPVLTRFEDYTDHAPAGSFASMPGGLILHGSGSGRASNPIDAEYAGTANWEVNNPIGLGWNATIGNGVVAVHLPPDKWGWNARAASDNYLAVEIAQPTRANSISDAQVQALADYIKVYVLPRWPNFPMNFPTHAEVERNGETGARDGKDDVFPFGDIRADQLRARLMERLNAAAPGPEPGPLPELPETDAEKVERMVGAIGYMGGDVANRFELTRSTLDDGVLRVYAGMPGEEAVEHLGKLWENVDRVYGELGQHGAELRRVRNEQLD